MLINKFTKISGSEVILVPYRKEHVEKYHNWMQSEELQKLTASTPLTLEEEYEMQASWMMDENKCTFIVLDKEEYNKNQNEIDSMIGDTNLFFSNEVGGMVAEAEIMTAEGHARGRRRGSQAIMLMLLYGILHLDVQQFVVKVLFENVISIEMFKRMSFVETERSEIFQEVTMNKIVDQDWVNWLKMSVGHYEINTTGES